MTVGPVKSSFRHPTFSVVCGCDTPGGGRLTERPGAFKNSDNKFRGKRSDKTIDRAIYSNGTSPSPSAPAVSPCKQEVPSRT